MKPNQEGHRVLTRRAATKRRGSAVGSRQSAVSAVLAVLLLLCPAIQAQGQGQGQGSGSNAGKPPVAAIPAATVATVDTPVTGQRMTVPAILLDDYDPVARGMVSMTFAGGYYRVVGGHDVSLPAMDVHIGLTSRLDIGVSTSLARTKFEDFQTTALGDAYIDAKIVLLKEGKRRPGLAFEPMLEILGRPSLANNPLAPNKVNAAFGGIIGKSLGDNFRVYNHTGYFTRGIVFSSAALEITRFNHVVPTLFCGYGRLTENREMIASLQLNSSRPDVGASLGFRLSKNWTGYVSTSRSLGRRDPNSIDFAISGGLSYSWRLFGE